MLSTSGIDSCHFQYLETTVKCSLPQSSRRDPAIISIHDGRPNISSQPAHEQHPLQIVLFDMVNERLICLRDDRLGSRLKIQEVNLCQATSTLLLYNSRGLDVNEVFSGQQAVGGAAIINHSVASVPSVR
jgi:hypothetical protein